jgi:hypothetical protein
MIASPFRSSDVQNVNYCRRTDYRLFNSRFAAVRSPHVLSLLAYRCIA